MGEFITATTMTTTMLGRTLTRSARQLTASPASLLSASSRRAFTSSSSKRQHFHDVDSQALKELFAKRGEDKVLVVDFYAQYARLWLRCGDAGPGDGC